jgi:hypothetical protein
LAASHTNPPAQREPQASCAAAMNSPSVGDFFRQFIFMT